MMKAEQQRSEIPHFQNAMGEEKQRKISKRSRGFFRIFKFHKTGNRYDTNTPDVVNLREQVVTDQQATTSRLDQAFRNNNNTNRGDDLNILKNGVNIGSNIAENAAFNYKSNYAMRNYRNAERRFAMYFDATTEVTSLGKPIVKTKHLACQQCLRNAQSNHHSPIIVPANRDVSYSKQAFNRKATIKGDRTSFIFNDSNSNTCANCGRKTSLSTSSVERNTSKEDLSLEKRRSDSYRRSFDGVKISLNNNRTRETGATKEAQPNMGKASSRLTISGRRVERILLSDDFGVDRAQTITITDEGDYAIVDIQGKEYKINKRNIESKLTETLLRDSRNLNDIQTTLSKLQEAKSIVGLEEEGESLPLRTTIDSLVDKGVVGSNDNNSRTVNDKSKGIIFANSNTGMPFQIDQIIGKVEPEDLCIRFEIKSPTSENLDKDKRKSMDFDSNTISINYTGFKETGKNLNKCRPSSMDISTRVRIGSCENTSRGLAEPSTENSNSMGEALIKHNAITTNTNQNKYSNVECKQANGTTTSTIDGNYEQESDSKTKHENFSSTKYQKLPLKSTDQTGQESTIKLKDNDKFDSCNTQDLNKTNYHSNICKSKSKSNPRDSTYAGKIVLTSFEKNLPTDENFQKSETNNRKRSKSLGNYSQRTAMSAGASSLTEQLQASRMRIKNRHAREEKARKKPAVVLSARGTDAVYPRVRETNLDALLDDLKSPRVRLRDASSSSSTIIDDCKRISRSYDSLLSDHFYSSFGEETDIDLTSLDDIGCASKKPPPFKMHLEAESGSLGEKDDVTQTNDYFTQTNDYVTQSTDDVTQPKENFTQSKYDVKQSENGVIQRVIEFNDDILQSNRANGALEPVYQIDDIDLKRYPDHASSKTFMPESSEPPDVKLVDLGLDSDLEKAKKDLSAHSATNSYTSCDNNENEKLAKPSFDHENQQAKDYCVSNNELESSEKVVNNVCSRDENSELALLKTKAKSEVLVLTESQSNEKTSQDIPVENYICETVKVPAPTDQTPSNESIVEETINTVSETISDLCTKDSSSIKKKSEATDEETITCVSVRDVETEVDWLTFDGMEEPNDVTCQLPEDDSVLSCQSKEILEDDKDDQVLSLSSDPDAIQLKNCEMNLEKSDSDNSTFDNENLESSNAIDVRFEYNLKLKKAVICEEPINYKHVSDLKNVELDWPSLPSYDSIDNTEKYGENENFEKTLCYDDNSLREGQSTLIDDCGKILTDQILTDRCSTSLPHPTTASSNESENYDFDDAFKNSKEEKSETHLAEVPITVQDESLRIKETDPNEYENTKINETDNENPCIEASSTENTFDFSPNDDYSFTKPPKSPKRSRDGRTVIAELIHNVEIPSQTEPTTDGLPSPMPQKTFQDTPEHKAASPIDVSLLSPTDFGKRRKIIADFFTDQGDLPSTPSEIKQDSDKSSITDAPVYEPVLHYKTPNSPKGPHRKTVIADLIENETQISPEKEVVSQKESENSFDHDRSNSKFDEVNIEAKHHALSPTCPETSELSLIHQEERTSNVTPGAIFNEDKIPCNISQNDDIEMTENLSKTVKELPMEENINDIHSESDLACIVFDSSLKENKLDVETSLDEGKLDVEIPSDVLKTSLDNEKLDSVTPCVEVKLDNQIPVNEDNFDIEKPTDEDNDNTATPLNESTLDDPTMAEIMDETVDGDLKKADLLCNDATFQDEPSYGNKSFEEALEILNQTTQGELQIARVVSTDESQKLSIEEIEPTNVENEKNSELFEEEVEMGNCRSKKGGSISIDDLRDIEATPRTIRKTIQVLEKELSRIKASDTESTRINNENKIADDFYENKEKKEKVYFEVESPNVDEPNLSNKISSEIDQQEYIDISREVLLSIVQIIADELDKKTKPDIQTNEPVKETEETESCNVELVESSAIDLEIFSKIKRKTSLFVEETDNIKLEDINFCPIAANVEVSIELSEKFDNDKIVNKKYILETSRDTLDFLATSTPRDNSKTRETHKPPEILQNTSIFDITPLEESVHQPNETIETTIDQSNLITSNDLTDVTPISNFDSPKIRIDDVDLSESTATTSEIIITTAEADSTSEKPADLFASEALLDDLTDGCKDKVKLRSKVGKSDSFKYRADYTLSTKTSSLIESIEDDMELETLTNQDPEDFEPSQIEHEILVAKESLKSTKQPEKSVIKNDDNFERHKINLRHVDKSTADEEKTSDDFQFKKGRLSLTPTAFKRRIPEDDNRFGVIRRYPSESTLRERRTKHSSLRLSMSLHMLDRVETDIDDVTELDDLGDIIDQCSPLDGERPADVHVTNIDDVIQNKLTVVDQSGAKSVSKNTTKKFVIVSKSAVKRRSVIKSASFSRGTRNEWVLQQKSKDKIKEWKERHAKENEDKKSKTKIEKLSKETEIVSDDKPVVPLPNVVREDTVVAENTNLVEKQNPSTTILDYEAISSPINKFDQAKVESEDKNIESKYSDNTNFCKKENRKSKEFQRLSELRYEETEDEFVSEDPRCLSKSLEDIDSRRDSWESSASNASIKSVEKSKYYEQGSLIKRLHDQYRDADFNKQYSWNILDLKADVNNNTNPFYLRRNESSKRNSFDVSYLFEKYQREREALQRNSYEMSDLSDISSLSDDDDSVTSIDELSDVESIHEVSSMEPLSFSSPRSAFRPIVKSDNEVGAVASPRASLAETVIKPLPSPVKPAFVPELSCFNDDDLGTMVLAQAASAVRNRRRGNRRQIPAAAPETAETPTPQPEEFLPPPYEVVPPNFDCPPPSYDRINDVSPQPPQQHAIAEPKRFSESLTNLPKQFLESSISDTSISSPSPAAKHVSPVKRQREKRRKQQEREKTKSMPDIMKRATGSSSRSDSVGSELFTSESGSLISCSSSDDLMSQYIAESQEDIVEADEADSSGGESFLEDDDLGVSDSEAMETEQIVYCGYPVCSKKQVTLGAQRSIFKTCQYCFTCYCTNRCKLAHWDTHIKVCLYGRINTYVKAFLAQCEKKKLNKYLRKNTTDNLHKKGKGCVNLTFKSPSEIKFAGRQNVIPNRPSYSSASDIETDKQNRHNMLLLQTISDYDPEQEFVLNLSIAVEKTSKKHSKKHPPPAVLCCARLPILRSTKLLGPTSTASYVIRTFSLPEASTSLYLNTVETRRYFCKEISKSLSRCGVRLKQYPDAYKSLCAYASNDISFLPLILYGHKEGVNYKCAVYPSAIQHWEEATGGGMLV